MVLDTFIYLIFYYKISKNYNLNGLLNDIMRHFNIIPFLF